MRRCAVVCERTGYGAPVNTPAAKSITRAKRSIRLIMDGRLPPGSVSDDGMHFWLGTDDQGRDMLSAIIYGLRISLGVGIGSALVACVVGAALGLVAAYAGRRTDGFIMRVVDLQLSFPSILVALMILAFLGKSVMNVVLALVLVEWAYYARTARGSALAERRREYIEAAECLALPRWQTLFDDLINRLTSDMIALKRDALKIGISAFRNYPYNSGQLKIDYKPSGGLSSLNLDGPLGKREFEVYLHPWTLSDNSDDSSKGN